MTRCIIFDISKCRLTGISQKIETKRTIVIYAKHYGNLSTLRTYVDIDNDNGKKVHVQSKEMTYLSDYLCRGYFFELILYKIDPGII